MGRIEMLIERDGTVHLQEITLKDGLSSDAFIKKYRDLFRGALLAKEQVGVFRCRSHMHDEYGNSYHVSVSFLYGTICTVVLIPILEVLTAGPYRDLRREEDERWKFCNRLLRHDFGTPDVSDSTRTAYNLDGCTVSTWLSVDPRDMCNGGCISVRYEGRK